jgi:hypothetical protein
MNINPTHSWDIFEKYVNVMNTYLNHFIACDKFINKDNDRLFLLINGLSTLTNVFKIMLKNTLNVDNAIETMEKSIYYYTQFIEQIEENMLCDLNVSSNSATIFVYKKTINHILFETIKSNADANGDDADADDDDDADADDADSDDADADNLLTIKNVDYLLLIYRSIFDKLIKTAHCAEQYNIDSHLCIKLIGIAKELCYNNTDETIFQREISNVMLFINHFSDYDNIITNEKRNDYIYLYIKKYKHYHLTLEGLCQKKTHIDYNEYIKKENMKHYIKWLSLYV